MRLTVWFCMINSCFASKILFLPMPQGKSHRGSMYAFAEILAKRGHEVEIFSEVIEDKSIPPKGVKETLLHVAGVPQAQKDFWVHGNSSGMKDMQWGGRMSPAMLIMPWLSTREICEAFLKNHVDQFWKLHNQKWDLILVDSLFNQCGVGFASLHHKKYRTPHAILHTSALEHVNRGIKGLNYNPSIEAPMFLDVEPMWSPQRFRDRFQGLWNWLSLNAIYSWGILSYFIKKTMSPVMKNCNFVEYTKNAQAHFVEFPEMLETPHSIGHEYYRLGSGCSNNAANPLSKELQKFVSKKNSKGTILVAFGNYVKWQKAPESIRNPFLDGLKLLTEYQIIFQNSGDKYDLPDHVMQIGWLPQKDILAHENTVLFISHGGLKSVKECLCVAMPILVVPIFGDQFYTAYAMQMLGIGDAVDKMMLIPHKFAQKARDVIKKNGNRQKIIAMRDQMSDRIMPDLERSAFWAERIIKLKGFPLDFYRRRGMDLSLIEYCCLDLIFVACATLLVSAVIFFKCTIRCFRMVYFNRKNQS